MPTNYKYIDPVKVPRRPKLFRKLVLAFTVLTIFATATYAVYAFQTRDVEEKILIGKFSEATDDLDHWIWLPLLNGRTNEALGTISILKDNAGSAQFYFDKASNKPFFKPLNIWLDVLKILWVNGRYHDGLAYVQHIEKGLEDQRQIHFYKSGFLAGENKLEEASRELQLAGNIPELASEMALLKSEIERRIRTRRYTFLIDRENLPLVKLNFKGDPNYFSDSIKPVLMNSEYNLVDSLKKVSLKNSAVLTLDYRIQNEAQKALEQYAGAIVLMDVKKGDILAAASNLKGIKTNYPDGTSLAMTHHYEPGSIIKMITLAGGLEHGLNLSKIVPFQCEGYLRLQNNKLLYCWKKDHPVNDMDIATATSCNVAFARIGLALKPAELINNLKQFGFDSKLPGMVPVSLGKIKEGSIDEMYLSNLSIGLENLEITPLHAAMLASAIANDGMCMAPRLVSGYRNIIGLPFGHVTSNEYRRFMSEKTSDVLTQAMIEVVKNAEGTGRRAAIPSFPFAMKTGTAGEGAKGYNAIIIGFGPVPDPKIAFAIFLEHAGKAEFEGARITRLFLESIQGYI